MFSSQTPGHLVVVGRLTPSCHRHEGNPEPGIRVVTIKAWRLVSILEGKVATIPLQQNSREPRIACTRLCSFAGLDSLSGIAYLRQGFVFFGVIPAFSVFLSVIPAFLSVQRAPSGGPGTITPLRLKHGVWFGFYS